MTPDPISLVVNLPADHPDLPGGQLLWTSFDGGTTWECATRPGQRGDLRWSPPVPAEPVP